MISITFAKNLKSITIPIIIKNQYFTLVYEENC